MIDELPGDKLHSIEKFRLDLHSTEIVITRDVTSNGKRFQHEMRFPYNNSLQNESTA